MISPLLFRRGVEPRVDAEATARTARGPRAWQGKSARAVESKLSGALWGDSRVTRPNMPTGDAASAIRSFQSKRLRELFFDAETATSCPP